jgi:hypothetical protein
MVLVLKKGVEQKKINDALRKLKQPKKFKSSIHLGKVKWGEDALSYQKRLRSEWD